MSGGNEFAMLVEVNHPLIKHHLSRLRDKRTPPAEFRQLVQRLAVLLAYEATQNLELVPREIETPLTRMIGQQRQRRPGADPAGRPRNGRSDLELDSHGGGLAPRSLP
jgi:uracil phosphoribosyltransferase